MTNAEKYLKDGVDVEEFLNAYCEEEKTSIQRITYRNDKRVFKKTSKTNSIRR